MQHACSASQDNVCVCVCHGIKQLATAFCDIIICLLYTTAQTTVWCMCACCLRLKKNDNL